MFVVFVFVFRVPIEPCVQFDVFELNKIFLMDLMFM